MNKVSVRRQQVAGGGRLARGLPTRMTQGQQARQAARQWFSKSARQQSQQRANHKRQQQRTAGTTNEAVVAASKRQSDSQQTDRFNGSITTTPSTSSTQPLHQHQLYKCKSTAACPLLSCNAARQCVSSTSVPAGQRVHRRQTLNWYLCQQHCQHQHQLQ